MGGFDTFARDIKVATAGLSQEAISAELAIFAKSELASAIQSGEGTPQYARYVNGREGAVEEMVRAPGPILYDFLRWDEVIEFALIELVKRSPKRTGRYARSFVVASGGKVVTSWDQLTADAEVVIFNAQPYTRKIEIGVMHTSLPPYHFDQVTALLRRKWNVNSGFSFISRFVNIKPGLHPLVPYILKRSGGRGRDRQPGSPLSYPAIVMNMVQ